MPRLAYVDGQIIPLASASVPVEDRGLQFADSVYEVCAVLNGRLLDWPLHLARLGRNLGELSIAAPMADAALSLVAKRLIAANRVTEALLYIQVSRGTAKRDHGFPSARAPTLVMTVRPFDFAQRVAQQSKGVAVISVADQRWGRCDIKTTGLLANVLAKQEARDAGAFEAWLVRDDGTVTEGGSTNTWIVDAGTIVTHPQSPHILPGVMRAAVIEAAVAAGIPLVERPFSLDEARGANEAFITSTTVPVLPVIRIDGHAIGGGKPGSIAALLAKAIWNRIATQTGYRP
ncbi:D-amino-acid transaminase [Polymorphobacter sp. PAMC 29334]|uniref:D-amino-acid transaminase n=1 Tax=Polymorphobacter sp. PAMC 29334 TaxID=2862331 RepID=UPI001C75B889|nr:D-amino-acid transaminase [Polymorphobacter sp. PAMC 29334]QYE34680.1 D-amino-acid transaminase [Polymorphobacter sp. PAMC 29334]